MHFNKTLILSKSIAMHDSAVFEVISCRGFRVQRVCWDLKNYTEHISCFERTVNWEDSAMGVRADSSVSFLMNLLLSHKGCWILLCLSVLFCCFWMHLKRMLFNLLPSYITMLGHLWMLNLICRSAFLQGFQIISWFWEVVIRSTVWFR